MEHLCGCQIPGLQEIAEGKAAAENKAIILSLKRALAKPWNGHVKKWLKKAWCLWNGRRPQGSRASSPTVGRPVTVALKPGDRVRVRSRAEIQATLNPWNELKGCAFLDEMWQYCETTQRVLQPLERFLDERDYTVKKARGIILLESVICHGTPVFGRCDRCCFLFWREEWLERVGSE